MARSLQHILNKNMRQVKDIKTLCDKCLHTERWDGNVVLMVVDAALTSSGLNYFTVVVPHVQEFRTKFIKTTRIHNLSDLAHTTTKQLTPIWKNQRSWNMAQSVASYLSQIAENDRKALRKWASQASLQEWRNDSIGEIKGVGINTFQYLRMMGGIDTVMPDNIVKRVINNLLKQANREPVTDDIKFINTVEEIAENTGYRAIELCWMTWFTQTEGQQNRMQKYYHLLQEI